MIYILLDTNILIDMLIDRRKHIDNTMLKSFIQLLDYSGDSIKIIMPNIIETELRRNIKNEFNQVGKKIKDAKEAIDGLYGVNTLNVNGLNVDEYKRKAIEQLEEALKEYENKKESYSKDILETINLLINHKNCIKIDDITLMERVLKRRVYKRAPFHKESKESYGDGTITETLINLNEFLTIGEEDVIYFVTGNYKDFSSSNRKILHEHILEDLEKSGIKDNVRYLTTFDELVRKELKEEIEQADMEEDFKEQYEYEMKIDMEDYEREIQGLSSLRDYESKVEQALYESDFKAQLSEINEEFGSIDIRIEEIIISYEELKDEILSLDKTDYDNVIKAFNGIDEICFCGGLCDLIEIVDWLDSKIESLKKLKTVDDLSEISFGNVLSVNSPILEYKFRIEDLYICPNTGSWDEIGMVLSLNDDERWLGNVEIKYGFTNYNDDFNVMDAEEEKIIISGDNIISQLRKIIKEWDEYIEDEEILIEDLKENINMYCFS